jgi:hypothetical protein
MSRTLSTGVTQNLEDDVIYPFYAVELQFDGNNVLRLWTGIGTLVYENNSYTGTGTLLDVSEIEETTEMAAKGAQLTLTGVPDAVISLALSEPYQGRIANIYFGMFQKARLERQVSTDSVKAYITLQDGGFIALEDQKTSLTEIFTGYMDQMDIDEGGDTSTIKLKVESKLIDLERPRPARYTSSYQKDKFPDDKGFDFVESLQDQKLVWGREVD